MSILENTYTDIFTEYDENIFSDGSIDPMGLRIIWTSLGNTIFNNKLNTISTDIWLYTINLFHHHIIQKYENNNQTAITNLIYNPPYNNKIDLYDGIIIFLESLLTQIVYRLNTNNTAKISIPGINKLTNIIRENQNSDKANLLIANSKEGVLVRHILLGIHGRHKGPFRQMGIFTDNRYYDEKNKEIWGQVAGIFDNGAWKKLENLLINIIDRFIFNNKNKKDGFISAYVNDVVNSKLEDAYANILNEDVFRDKKLINFWEDKLGLNNGAAKLLYDELKDASVKENYENIIRLASTKGDNEDNKYIKAICAIEPFISRIEKISHKILNRGITDISNELKEFISEALNDKDIDLNLVQKYLTTDFLNSEALNRTKNLFDIYHDAKTKKDAVLFIQKLIEYHKNLMETRGNLPWISIGNNNNITQHRTLFYSSNEINKLAEDYWINNYYLSTVLKLYKGLYQE